MCPGIAQASKASLHMLLALAIQALIVSKVSRQSLYQHLLTQDCGSKYLPLHQAHDVFQQHCSYENNDVIVSSWELLKAQPLCGCLCIVLCSCSLFLSTVLSENQPCVCPRDCFLIVCVYVWFYDDSAQADGKGCVYIIMKKSGIAGMPT